MKLNAPALLLALFAFYGVNARALDPQAWKFQQPVPLETAGPVRFALPSAALDSARADLGDLRLLGPDGKEAPYALLPLPEGRPGTVGIRDFTTRLEGRDTVATFSLEAGHRINAIRLDSPSAHFLAAAALEISEDGERWETLAEQLPFFRQDGAERLAFTFPARELSHVRVRLSRPLNGAFVLTGAEAFEAARFPEVTDLGARPFTREDFDDETILTVDLGNANETVQSLEFTVADTLFNRTLTAGVRTWSDGEVTETVLASGNVFRLDTQQAALARVESLTLPVRARVSGRELIVHVRNGDSPALSVSEVRVTVAPRQIVVSPTRPGRHLLLTGNPDVRPPVYDLAAFAGDFVKLPLTAVQPEARSENPSYQRPSALGDWVPAGAPLDPSGWEIQRALKLSKVGLQQLELDASALANSRRDFSDLRIVNGGVQVPFVLERTSLSRRVDLPFTLSNDPKRPALSRWKVTLPVPHFRFNRLTLRSPTPLFQRSLSVAQLTQNSRGDAYEEWLAEGQWSHRPGEPEAAFSLEITRPVAGDELWLTTDNGDNPPLALRSVTASQPVVRLLFHAASLEGYQLLYSNRDVGAPRYDLGLLAGTLLGADKAQARLADEAKPEKPAASVTASSLFWVALAAVVVGLLAVIGKLLPKSGA